MNIFIVRSSNTVMVTVTSSNGLPERLFDSKHPFVNNAASIWYYCLFIEKRKNVRDEMKASTMGWLSNLGARQVIDGCQCSKRK